jgi:hypothetical protein
MFKYLAFFVQNTGRFCKIWIKTLVFKKTLWPTTTPALYVVVNSKVVGLALVDGTWQNSSLKKGSHCQGFRFLSVYLGASQVITNNAI